MSLHMRDAHGRGDTRGLISVCDTPRHTYWTLPVVYTGNPRVVVPRLTRTHTSIAFVQTRGALTVCSMDAIRTLGLVSSE